MTRPMVAASRSDEDAGDSERTERKFSSRVEHNHRPVLSAADGRETVALPPE
jgi:hypothetical protein